MGDPRERFTEDALRILRAVRFSAQLDFEIEAETKAALAEFAPRLRKVSAERIQVELMKLLTSDHPEVFRVVWETGITAVILPGIRRLHGDAPAQSSSLPGQWAIISCIH